MDQGSVFFAEGSRTFAFLFAVPFATAAEWSVYAGIGTQAKDYGEAPA